MEDSFSSADFETAASATASPETAPVETSAATPEAASVTAETLDPAATAPATATSPIPPVSEKKGPIPFDVHEKTLHNSYAERDAARQELQTFKQQYDWATKVPQASLEHMSNIADRMTKDRVGFLDSYYKECANDPQSAAEVRSWAAKTLGSRQGRAPESDVPDVEIVGADNQVIGNLRDIVQRVAADLVSKEVGPLKQDHAQRASREKAAADKQQLDAKVDALFARAATWKGWPQSESDPVMAEISAAMTAHPDWTLHDAYIEVVVPQLDKLGRVSVIADTHRKSAASTVSPGRSTTAVPTPDAEKSWEQLFEEKAALHIGR